MKKMWNLISQYVTLEFKISNKEIGIWGYILSCQAIISNINFNAFHGKELFEDNPLAIVSGTGAIEGHIITPGARQVLNEQYNKELRKILRFFIEIVRVEPNQIQIVVFSVSIIKITW